MSKEEGKRKRNLKLDTALKYLVPIIFIVVLIVMIVMISSYPDDMEELFIASNKVSLEDSLTTACNVTGQSATEGKNDCELLANNLTPFLDSTGVISDYAVNLLTALRDKHGYQNVGLSKVSGSSYYSATTDIDTVRRVDSWVFTEEIRTGKVEIDMRTSPFSTNGGEVIVYRYKFETADNTEYMIILEKTLDKLVANLAIGGNITQKSSTIFVEKDGSLIYQYGDMEEIPYNFIEFLGDYLPKDDVTIIKKEFYGSNPSGNFTIEMDGENYFFIYKDISNTDFVCIKCIPESALVGDVLDEVNEKTSALIISVAVIVVTALFFVGFYIIRKLRDSGEKKVHEREILFRAMSAHTPTAYLILRANDKEVYFTSGNFKDVTGVPDDFVYDQEHIVEWIGAHKDELNDIANVHDLEFEITKNERVFKVGIYQIGVFNDEQYHALVLDDITKDKQINELLERTAKEAEQASRSKTEFLSRMSHEIRTPLNAILGFTSLAIKNWESADREVLKDYISKVDSSGHYLVGIVSDVLDINRIEEGRLVITNSEFKLSTIVNEVANTFEGQMSNKGIAFNVTKEYEDVNILADKEHITQILNNLISNSFKFTNVGGFINFDTKVTVKTKKAFVKFTVQDNGIGMSEEFVKKIFDPFTQEYNKDLKGNYRGSGLGMSICKSLVDMMGGTISVESKLKEGSKFVIGLTFPIVEVKEEETVDKVLDTSKLQGKKILLVEDNELNREVARFTFEDYGLIFEEAEDGQVGLDKFIASHENEYFALFVDIRMPVMNGYDCAKAIRALDRADAKTVPIFAMTADASPDDISRTYMCGMNHHISKPINPDIVIEKLMSYID